MGICLKRPPRLSLNPCAPYKTTLKPQLPWAEKNTRENIAAYTQLLGFVVALSRFWRSRWFGLESHGVPTNFWLLFFSKPKLQSLSLGWLELFLQNCLVVSPTPFRKNAQVKLDHLGPGYLGENRKYVRNHHSLSFMVFFGIFKLSFQVNEYNCQINPPCSLKKCWKNTSVF